MNSASSIAASVPGQVPLLRTAATGYVRAVESAADAESGILAGVIARFRSMVQRVGVQRGLLDADLDEVLQEVRIRLWRAEQSGKDLQSLGSSYIYHVATTAAVDLLRRRRARGGDQASDLDEHDDLPARMPTPHEDAEARELAHQIESAVESLPADRRVAVRFHLSGYDRHDIARALGWTEARTRNLLYRGLDEVRRRLTLMGVAPRRAG